MAASKLTSLRRLQDPARAASAGHLLYVTDARPGLRRIREARGFRYQGPRGVAVKNATVLRRIRSLVIPPAWTQVWISPHPNGHLQATGRDARGRKQYRYHPRWREVREAAKYARMIAFGEALPRIRRRVKRDLAAKGLSRKKVLATVTRLLEESLIRVGNEEYVKANDSFGLTTMKSRHVDVSGSEVHFEFRGKAGKLHHVDVQDRRVARIIRRCQELPGQELFQYLAEDGKRQKVDSADVNDYLREIGGKDFTAKDFRTWAGTVLAATALCEFEEFDSETEARRNVVRAIESVAQRLGNAPAICRKCYVHPEVISAYLDGTLARSLKPRANRLAKSLHKLPPEEAAVLVLLQRRLAQNALKR